MMHPALMALVFWRRISLVVMAMVAYVGFVWKSVMNHMDLAFPMGNTLPAPVAANMISKTMPFV